MKAITFASAMLSGLLLVFLVAAGAQAFADQQSTGLAFIALVMALPVVDEALFGEPGQIHVALAAIVLALPFGFFVRQHMVAIAQSDAARISGSETILGFAGVVSVGIRVGRWYFKRYRQGRSTHRD